MTNDFNNEDHDIQIDGAQSAVALDGSHGIAGVVQSTPWWIISVMLHTLVIIFASLVGMTIDMGDSSRALVVTTTVLERQADDPAKREDSKPRKLDALVTKDVAPTDPDSTESSEIAVPPDILARAALGDHFETINLDRPDTHSAFGNPEAHMFHSDKGSDDAAGGGGTNGASLEDVIGAGGMATLGTGGGWGGGNGTGVGNDNGAGRGSFGLRTGGGRQLMVKRHGGNQATEAAVEAGLAWLARHQTDAGNWVNGPHGGGSSGPFDDAVTGLATLAFLGAGHTERIGEYKENVRKAIHYLMSQQNEDGYIGNCGYPHAIAMMALCESYAMCRNPEVGAAAQKAVNWATDRHQTVGADNYTRSGWEYRPRGDRPTLAVTAWFIMGLKAAKIAGLKVDGAAFDGGLKFLDSVTKVGEQSKDGYSTDVTVYYRPGGEYYKGGAIREEDHIRRMQATGLLIRMFTGYKRGEPVVDGGVKKVIDSGLPDWNRKDVYHWYYATYDMFQAGGLEWKAWNNALKTALVPNQIREHKGGACNCKDNDDHGSWSPENESYTHKSRIWVTSASILALEVYYRYAKVEK